MHPALLALGLGGLLASRHPIHSSSATLTLAADGRRAVVVLRAFADDLPTGRAPPAIAGYLTARFRLADRAGRPIALQLDAVRLEGPLFVLTLQAVVPEGLSGIRVSFGVLAERFPDQVNFLQAHYGQRTVSLLFTASDGAKSLP